MPSRARTIPLSATVTAWAERAAAWSEPGFAFSIPSSCSNSDGKGFKVIEDLGAWQIAERFFGVPRLDILLGPGPHIVRAHR
jgi:hypothetical protein